MVCAANEWLKPVIDQLGSVELWFRSKMNGLLSGFPGSEP